MDTCQVSVNTFDRLAETYAQKYLALDTYDAYYRQFCSHVARQGATVLDVACGPGNVSAFLVRERPDIQVLGIDLAPSMVRLAQTHVPSASFLVHDCRHLADLGRVFDGIAYAFGLNYLNQEDAEQFFVSLSKVLAPNGALYLSTMSGATEHSGLQTSSSGDQIYVYYRPRQEIERLVQSAGLELVFLDEIASPANASRPTIDVVLVALRVGADEPASAVERDCAKARSPLLLRYALQGANVTDMKKGAIFALASSLLVALLFAYIFRIPIPMGGYIGPFGIIGTYGISVVDVLISVLVAWVFYGMFGGFIILPLLGAFTGEIVGRKYAESENKNKMILLWAFLISAIPVFILSILDYLIGPW